MTTSQCEAAGQERHTAFAPPAAIHRALVRIFHNTVEVEIYARCHLLRLTFIKQWGSRLCEPVCYIWRLIPSVGHSRS